MDMNLFMKSIQNCPDCRDNGGDFSQDEREGIPLCAFHLKKAEKELTKEVKNILNKFKRSTKQCNQ